MKKFVSALSKAEDKITKVEGVLIALVLLFIVFITAYFAIGRKFFARPPLGLDELARYLVPIIMMFGASVAIRDRSHITAGGMSLFTKNEKVLFISQLVIDVLLIVACVMLTYASWVRYAAVLTNTQKTTTLYIPMSWLELPIPVGTALWLLQFILQLLKDIAHHLNGDSEQIVGEA